MNCRKFGIAPVFGTALATAGLWMASTPQPLFGQSAPVGKDARPAGFAAVPGQKGGQDFTGAYDVVPDWPKPLSQIKGHDKWTFGAVQGIFAENPNRVFILMRGELPVVQRPPETPGPQFGPSLTFPVPQAPLRNASVGPLASPGNQGNDGWNGWKGKMGVDARWEHCVLVVDAQGNYIEEAVWNKWNDKFRRPHSVTINPYDPEKHIWIVDDRMHAVYKFTHDGKTLVQTLGVPGVPGNDDKHFNRPTFLSWKPDSTLFVSDGYANTRVVKFDKDGKFLMTWGQKGNPPDDTRPGYFDAVHGVQYDPATGRVYVTDRSSHRIQVFDENGKFIDQFSTGKPSTPQVLYLTADKYLWIADNETSKFLKYDTEGHFLYSWGSGGQFPGQVWNVHGFSVDQDGNFYVAEVNNGRAEKFRPRAGANKDMLIGQPIRSAWK